MVFNDIAKGIVEGLMQSKEAERRRKDWSFQELDETPFLFSAGYLDELREKATKKTEFEGILEHMYRHNATEVENYRKVEQKIIDKYWR